MLECIVICRFMILNNLLHTRFGVKKLYFTNKSYCLWELIFSLYYYYLSTYLMNYKVKWCVNLIFMRNRITWIWIFDLWHHDREIKITRLKQMSLCNQVTNLSNEGRNWSNGYLSYVANISWMRFEPLILDLVGPVTWQVSITFLSTQFRFLGLI